MVRDHRARVGAVDLALLMLNEPGLTRALSRGAVLFIALVVVVVCALLLRYVFIQLFVAIIIAAGMAPVVAVLSDPLRTQGWRWRPPRALVVLLIYAVACVVVLLIALLLLRVLTFEGQVLLERVPQYADAAQAWLDSQARVSPLLQALGISGFSLDVFGLEQYVMAIVRQLAGAATLLVSLFGGAITVLFVLFMALYLTVDRESMLEYLLVFAPVTREDQVRRVLDHIWNRLSAWVIGQSVLSIVVGVAAWIGLAILGVPGAAILGLIWAVGELIPGIGPFISAVPTIVLGFAAGPTTGMLTAVFSLILSQVANNVLLPRVMSTAVKLNPLAVLLALLIGNELLGVVGALIAVPAAAAFAVVVDELRLQRRAPGRPNHRAPTAAADD
jgi:predicted PurR-regulated permease PerM